MNKKDILELKRRMKKEECTFTRLCGCYVDSHKNIVLHISESFLNLVDEEFYKYLEIAKKTLSGTIGNNLLELEFNNGENEKQNFLLGLRDSALKSEALLDRLYELIIENFSYDGNYLILLFHDAYDVIVKTTDNNKLDESEEVYDYIICSICPVELTKAALGYREAENRIGARIRDWVVSPPELGFVFPAFTNRSTDIHSLMYYGKNPKTPHTDFMEAALGCKPRRTAAVEKKTFDNILKATAEDDNIIMDVHQALSDIADEQECSTSSAPAALDSRTMESLITSGGISPEIAAKIEKACEEEFGDEPPVIENIVDTKALEKYRAVQKENELRKEVQELKSKLDEVPWNNTEDNIVVNVSPDKAKKITAKIIDGSRCIVIPLENEHMLINGVETEL